VSLRWAGRRTGTTLTVAAALVVAGCAVAEPSHRLPAGYRLIQKGEFQALYGPGGHIERLLQDRNHDGRAEAVVIYRPDGRPDRGELDTDGDGVVDRWEHFDGDGRIEKIGVSRARDGRPDQWESIGPDGRSYRRDPAADRKVPLPGQ